MVTNNYSSNSLPPRSILHKCLQLSQTRTKRDGALLLKVQCIEVALAYWGHSHEKFLQTISLSMQLTKAWVSTLQQHHITASNFNTEVTTTILFTSCNPNAYFPEVTSTVSSFFTNLAKEWLTPLHVWTQTQRSSRSQMEETAILRIHNERTQLQDLRVESHKMENSHFNG